MTDQELIEAAKVEIARLIVDAQKADETWTDRPSEPVIHAGWTFNEFHHIQNCSPDQVLRIWRKDLVLVNRWQPKPSGGLTTVWHQDEIAANKVAVETARAYTIEAS